MRKKKGRVLVGLSGGVDSSVAAAILIEQGYEVEGAFMKNWSLPISAQHDGCAWRDDLEDVRSVAKALKIRWHFFDFEEAYHQRVIEPFFADYKSGVTPNPDTLCNRTIKFGLFLERAIEMGFDFVATGHYARKTRTTNRQPPTVIEEIISRGIDQSKDQSYFLWGVKPEVLSKVLFPIGELSKVEVRKRAKKLGLITATKKDSQGICFVGKIDLMTFLQTRLPVTPGQVRSVVKGRIVGEHQGVWFYTEGQRQKLGSFGGGIPYYVVEKDLKSNTLWVAPGADHQALFRTEMTVTELNWFTDQIPERLSVQIRYRHPDVPCQISRSGSSLQVIFNEPQRAVTPGQSAVFYDSDRLIGGGVINRHLDSLIPSLHVAAHRVIGI